MLGNHIEIEVSDLLIILLAIESIQYVSHRLIQMIIHHTYRTMIHDLCLHIIRVLFQIHAICIFQMCHITAVSITVFQS